MKEEPKAEEMLEALVNGLNRFELYFDLKQELKRLNTCYTYTGFTTKRYFCELYSCTINQSTVAHYQFADNTKRTMDGNFNSDAQV
jgi:hypothetical protein